MTDRTQSPSPHSVALPCPALATFAVRTAAAGPRLVPTVPAVAVGAMSSARSSSSLWPRRFGFSFFSWSPSSLFCDDDRTTMAAVDALRCHLCAPAASLQCWAPCCAPPVWPGAVVAAPPCRHAADAAPPLCGRHRRRVWLAPPIYGRRRPSGTLLFLSYPLSSLLTSSSVSCAHHMCSVAVLFLCDGNRSVIDLMNSISNIVTKLTAISCVDQVQ